jgi:hypothetical protein
MFSWCCYWADVAHQHLNPRWLSASESLCRRCADRCWTLFSHRCASYLRDGLVKMFLTWGLPVGLRSVKSHWSSDAWAVNGNLISCLILLSSEISMIQVIAYSSLESQTSYSLLLVIQVSSTLAFSSALVFAIDLFHPHLTFLRLRQGHLG